MQPGAGPERLAAAGLRGRGPRGREVRPWEVYADVVECRRSRYVVGSRQGCDRGGCWCRRPRASFTIRVIPVMGAGAGNLSVAFKNDQFKNVNNRRSLLQTDCADLQFGER